jgi:hypothetical protein
MLEQGSAYINIDVNAMVYMKVNQSEIVSLAVFAASEDHHHDSLIGMCDQKNLRDNYWASNIYVQPVPTTYVGSMTVMDPQLDLNGTYYLWTAPLVTKYRIRVEEWHNVAFQLCSEESEGPIALVEGKVEFRNPYGFIPAELFGFLPFEGARMVAYFLFGVIYCYFFWKHQESTLPIHKGVLFVFLVALAEATCWYAAYQTINLTGQPYCCPFPSTVVASLVLQIFRQTFARALLLVVSLGYGIVRPKLLPAEWIAVAVVSVLYFITAIIAQVSEIVLVHDIHGDSPESVLSYQIPELFMDVLFLSWIYLALSSTMRILTEFQQGYKLNLFRQLATTIAFFVGLFSLATLLILLDKSNIIKWPWQWAWVQQVLWEILNFAVLAAVCIICCPSDNSQRLSYASQLPTDDPDDDEDDYKGRHDGSGDDEGDGDYGPGRGFEGDDEDRQIYGDDDDDVDEDDAILQNQNRIGSKPRKGDPGKGVEMSTWRSTLASGVKAISPRGGGGSSSSNHTFSSLPAAEDEDEEFGLKESSPR